MKRKAWDTYFLEIARIVSTRSTCTRKKVGAVIIDPKTKAILSTGYNGSLPGAEHCIDTSCHVVDNHCIRTIHAETNAINHAAKSGSNLSNCAIYCTTQPCWNCFKNIIQAGITEIYFNELYLNLNDHILYKKYLEDNRNIIYKRVPL